MFTRGSCCCSSSCCCVVFSAVVLPSRWRALLLALVWPHENECMRLIAATNDMQIFSAFPKLSSSSRMEPKVFSFSLFFLRCFSALIVCGSLAVLLQ